MSRFIVANRDGHTVLYRDLPNNEKQVLSVDNQVMNGINSVFNLNQSIVKFDKERKVLILQSLTDGSSLVFLNFEKILELPELKTMPSIIAQLCERNGYLDLAAKREKSEIVRTSGKKVKTIKKVSALVLMAGIVLSFFSMKNNELPNTVEASDVTLPQASNYAVVDEYESIMDDTVDTSNMVDDFLPVERPYIPENNVVQSAPETEQLTQRLTTMMNEIGEILDTSDTVETTLETVAENPVLETPLETAPITEENDWFETEQQETTEPVISYVDYSAPTLQKTTEQVSVNKEVSSENLNGYNEVVAEPTSYVEPSYDNTNNYAQDSGTTVYLEFPDYSDTDKAVYCKNNYYGLIEYYAHLYGLDPNLVLGIATQERGVHATTVDPGGAIGLMQIQYNVLINSTLTVYELNEATGNYEPRELAITDDKLVSVDGNIRIGCAILQYNLIESNYNLPVALQAYNMGPYALKTIISRYAYDHGVRPEDVLNNSADIGWINYRKGINGDIVGDYNYIENVNSWVDNNSYTIIDVRNKQPINFTFTNYNEQIRGK